jgi:hypothetical protein
MSIVEEIEKLTAFLPHLYALDFSPIRRWKGNERTENGAITMPWPKYEPVVREFFEAASAPCWTDTNYLAAGAAEMLADEALVRNASLDQVRTMLTFCVRGERFCDGHWGVMIREGHIRRLLERLNEIESEEI